MTPAPKTLIVDDDAVSRLVLAHVLRRLGHDIAEADSVAAALVCFDDVRPALVVSDFMMPDGTGLDLLTELRRRPHPPLFVLVTGSGEHNGLDDDRAGLLDGYLTKPVGSREMRECVEHLPRAPRSR